MIAYLSGKIIQILDRSIVINTGNIGYETYVAETLKDQLEIDAEIELFTYTHVREDALDIFGFTTQKELNFFKQLISISGVGPKTAQDILSLPIDKLKSAIINEEPTFICTVPKIGKKIADRIILELKNKIEIDDMDRLHRTTKSPASEDAISALEKLGYSRKQISQTLVDLPEDIKTPEQIIKFFLQHA
jgi:holliday junction DNA helicase RuvA